MDIDIVDEPTYMPADTWCFLSQRSLDLGCTATERFGSMSSV
ncbi:hypothetical protein AA0115_g12023 [Alternaria tenuissima]|uniref:Uncharacterized protein n=1 Tax=Alternaria tenuissima TaxID=119927 RepID=A0AB37VZA6_9PLEO|nr:hypothetical protein AA0115_g12023 [Alternaria tenuissima]